MNSTNVFDLGYIYFSVCKEKVHSMNREFDNRFAGNYFLGGVDFFLRFFYYLFKSPFNYRKVLKKKDAILIYGESVNNRNTLLPIIQELGEDKVINLNSHKQYPKWLMYWYAIPHLFELVKETYNASSEKREIIKCFFAKFWMMYGCNKEAGELLDFYKPQMLVMANDHLPFHRALMREANVRNIPTVYVQHAAVTEEFPPLGFSYSLLDGEDSYNKYKTKSETEGRIYLCGGIRFDAIKEVKQNKPQDLTVGVAINLMDDESLVKNTCIAIKNGIAENDKAELILRPHPQMQLDVWKEWCNANDIRFSYAREESSFQFLSRISVLVSNQSSIHLDAAMCHTPSIVFKLSNNDMDDSFAFVRNGLTVKADNLENLLTLVVKSDQCIPEAKAVKYYNCSYGTGYEGNVAKMMADLIDSVNSGKESAFINKYGFEIAESDEKKTVYKV